MVVCSRNSSSWVSGVAALADTCKNFSSMAWLSRYCLVNSTLGTAEFNCVMCIATISARLCEYGICTGRMAIMMCSMNVDTFFRVSVAAGWELILASILSRISLPTVLSDMQIWYQEDHSILACKQYTRCVWKKVDTRCLFSSVMCCGCREGALAFSVTILSLAPWIIRLVYEFSIPMLWFS